MVLERIITAADSGAALGSYIKREFGISSRLLKKIKTNFSITVNGNITFTNYILMENDHLSVDLDRLASVSDSIVPEDIPLEVLYEDEYVVIINKQAGRIIHPSTHESGGTIANGLARRFELTGCMSKIHPISRLDRDTSGVILFAKDSYTANILGEDIRKGGFQKEYLGVAEGALNPSAGFIDTPLGRVPGFIMLRAARCDGKAAVTYYETLHHSRGLSLFRLQPITGRTHQLRVHLSTLGAPLLSDSLYGPAGPKPDDIPHPGAFPHGPADPEPAASHPHYNFTETEPFFTEKVEFEITHMTHTIDCGVTCIKQNNQLSSVLPPAFSNAGLPTRIEPRFTVSANRDCKFTAPLPPSSLTQQFTTSQPSPPAPLISRQALHSWRLTFRHPHTKMPMTITGPPPQDFLELLEYIGYNLP